MGGRVGGGEMRGGMRGCPADPGLLQGLHDTGQQRDAQGESQWGSRVDGAAETKGLKPGQ